MNSSTLSKAQTWADVFYRAACLRQNGSLFTINPAAESCGLNSADEEELRRWLYHVSPVGGFFRSFEEQVVYYLLLSDALRAGDLPTDSSELDVDIVQEFTPDGSHHRLRNVRTGKCTSYADYRGFTYMDGVVGWTAYYGVSEGTGTPEDFMKLAAVGVEESRS